MQVFKEISSRKEICLIDKLPERVEYQKNSPAIWYFTKGNGVESCCIKCNNPRCLRFSKQEVAFNYLDNFTYDTSTTVCPSGALQWDEKSEMPVILQEKCIHCGLCIRRCPVGAIYEDQTKSEIKVSSNKKANISSVPVTKANVLAQQENISQLCKVKRTGMLIVETDDVLEQIYDKISALLSNNDYNLFVRNLFLSLNCKCAVSRVGDVYTRMDAVYSTNNRDSFGVIEVEFGKDTLDASRGVLDDIAVLNARYGIPKEKNDAVVVCLQLPNARQGYWQVIKDVLTVENLPISTITVGALLILMWNFKSFNLKEHSYYADYDNMSIREALKDHIGRQIALSDKTQGILEPQK